MQPYAATFDAMPGTPPEDAAALLANRRRHGRVVVSPLVQCSIGEVIDLSISGIRVLSRRTHSAPLSLTLIAPGLGVRLTAEVVWARRVGFRRHLLGLHFLDPDPHSLAILTRIASEYRTHRSA